MPSTDDLTTHATSSVDFYALLSLTPAATDPEIRSAFRKTSLKYHPDKVGSTNENVEKFLLVKTAHDVLSDPKIRALYDQTREARERRQAETEKLDAGRRKMVSELERKERNAQNLGGTRNMGIKRRRSGEEESAEEKLERMVRSIAEENRRMKEAMIERRDRERLEEEERRDRERLQEEERLADEKEARKRLKMAKVRDVERQKQAPSFSFPRKMNSAQDSTGHDPEQAQHKDLVFEKTILQRLKIAQREKVR